MPADAELDGYVARAQTSGDSSSATALSAFVRQMAAFPRLSAEQQQELVQYCQDGRAARAALASGTLRRADLRRAQDAVTRADRAMTHLLGSTIKLVILIVRENAERRLGPQRAITAVPDLVAECMAALTKAVYDFDPARVPSFSTYAARVVRDTVRMSLSDDTMMHVPASWARIRRIAAVRVPNLIVELGRQPTPQEVREAIYQACLEWAAEHLTPAEAATDPTRRQELMVAKLRKQGMLGAIENLDEVLATARTIGSLDLVVGDGGGTVGDLVAAPVDAPVFDRIEREELRESIQQALAGLPEREREVIVLRFDLNRTGETWTHRRIAERYGVTAERIRQIERNALTRLRPPHGSSSGLAAFLPTASDEDDFED